jgi:hypothetical protein
MNRLSKQPEHPATKLVLVQTPMGVFKFAVPALPGPDAVAIAMNMFQSALDAGSDDPLTETLTSLKQMAIEGSHQPLLTGLMILKQMGDSGLLPPLPVLVEGTGITEHDVKQALGALNKRPEGLFMRMEQVFLN